MQAHILSATRLHLPSPSRVRGDSPNRPELGTAIKEMAKYGAVSTGRHLTSVLSSNWPVRKLPSIGLHMRSVPKVTQASRIVYLHTPQVWYRIKAFEFLWGLTFSKLSRFSMSAGWHTRPGHLVSCFTYQISVMSTLQSQICRSHFYQLRCALKSNIQFYSSWWPNT